MLSASPWFWEKLHCAAAEHAQLALDYKIPSHLRSPLEEWRSIPRKGQAGAAASSFNQREHAQLGSQAPDPVRFPVETISAQPQRGKQVTGSPQPEPSVSQLRNSLKGIEGSSASTRDQSRGASNRRQEPTILEARSLLSKLLQPEAEASGFSETPALVPHGRPLPAAAAASKIFGTERGADDTVEPSTRRASRHQELKEWDGLEAAMNRMQSSTEVRQMLAATAMGGKPRKDDKDAKDSASSASTQAGSRATSVTGSPRSATSRVSSKEIWTTNSGTASQRVA